MQPEKSKQSQKLTLASGDGILCTGLPRSGTASLAKALEILGIEDVHHGVDMHVNRPRELYGWGQAAWCNFPFLQLTRRTFPTDLLPFYMNPGDTLMPWTRLEWNRLVGRYRVSTDFGSLFSEHLIRAYPEAKVIYVERPVDKWAKSFQYTILDGICFGIRGFIVCDVAPFLGQASGVLVRDITTGFLKASTRNEALQRLPEVHKEHAEMVRCMVPADQLLEYKLGDGWEPLCEFLNVPVPDEPFPRTNDSKEFMALSNYAIKMAFVVLAIRVARWSFLGGAVFFAWKYIPWSMLTNTARTLDI